MVIKKKKHTKLGNRIRKAIEFSGKNQAEIAKLMGIPPSNLNRWIQGKVAPSYEYIAIIGNLTGVSHRWLLTEEGPISVEEKKEIEYKTEVVQVGGVAEGEGALFNLKDPEEIINVGMLLKILRGRNYDNIIAIKANIKAFAATADIDMSPPPAPAKAKEEEKIQAKKKTAG